jgi:hypothetical protein
MKMHGISTSTLDGGEWFHALAALPPATYGIQGWVDTRAGMDAVVQSKNFLSLRGNGTPAAQLLAPRYTYWATARISCLWKPLFVFTLRPLTVQISLSEII